MELIVALNGPLNLPQDLPPRTPSKKPDDDSHIPHKREEHSPILKKSSVTLQIRSESCLIQSQCQSDVDLYFRAFKCSRA